MTYESFLGKHLSKVGQSLLFNVITDSDGSSDDKISLQSMCCNSLSILILWCSRTSRKYTVRLTGFIVTLGGTITARWSDRTKLGKTVGVSHRSGRFVRNTSRVFTPLAALVTSCLKACCVTKSLMSSWFMSPATINLALGSFDKIRSQQLD